MRTRRATAWLLGFTGLYWAALAAAQDSPRPWNDYRVIMWVGDTARQQPEKYPLFLQRLREMGVDTAMVYGADASAQPLLDQRFPFYVENIVNRGLCLKWNSKVGKSERSRPLSSCQRG